MRCLVPPVLGFLCLPHVARGAEPPPDALPSGAVARLCWSPLRIGYGDFALTPDGRSIVVVTPQGNFRRLDAKTGRLLEHRQLTDRGDVDPTGNFGVTLSATGQVVAIEERSYTDRGFTGPRVTVYDVASGKQIFRRASSETRHLLQETLSPDGGRLAIVEWPVSADKRSLRLFDLKSGRSRHLGMWKLVEIGLHFSADGKRLLVSEPLPRGINPGTGASNLVLFDAISGKELWRRKLSFIANLAISPDGKTVLASGYRDQTGMESGFQILQTDAAAAKPTERFMPCHRRSKNAMGVPVFTTLLLAPDNRTIVARLFDEIYLWDLHTGKEIRRFTLLKDSRKILTPFWMAVSADSRTLLTNVGHLQRWDLTTGKPLFQTPADNGLPDFPVQLAFTPDSKELVGCSNRWLLGRWNVATGKRTDLRGIPYSASRLILTASGIRAVRSDVRGEREDQCELTVFDPVADKSLNVIRWPSPGGIGGPSVRHLSLTADGKRLLTIYEGEPHPHAAVWDVATGRKRSDFALETDYGLAQSPFSPCGRWMLLRDKLHHVGSGKELFELRGRPGETMNYGDMSRVWFSADGRLMAASLGSVEEPFPRAHTLITWELASGQVLARFPKPGLVAQAAFAPDGRTIALLNAQGVRLMDLLSGKEVTTFPAPDVVCHLLHGGAPQPQTLVFAPDGATLATGHQDGSIVLWKVPRSRPAHANALADGEAEKLWKDLGNSSPATARATVKRLVCHPDAAVSLLATRFRPPPADAKIAALLGDLDSDEFARREEASRKLRAYGARAEPALRRTLAKAPSLEMRRRIEGILAEMPPPALRLPLTGDQLRGVRADEMLERIGSAAARRQLQGWADQTDDVQLALEARLALERLGSAGTKAKPPQQKQSP